MNEESPLQRIFTKRGANSLSELLPLWKYFPLDDENFLDELATYIRNHAGQDRLTRCRAEIVVYYAGWWRSLSTTTGGEKDRLIAEAIGITDERQRAELRRISRNAVDVFNLPVVRGRNYRLLQASLFTQGGFPLWMLRNREDAVGVYAQLMNFLSALYEQWEDYCDFDEEDYKELAKATGLAMRYHSDALLLSCHSLIEELRLGNEDNTLPEREDLNRIREMRRAGVARVNTMSFRLDWSLRIDSEQNYSIHYRPYCPQHVTIINAPAEFRVRLNDSLYIGRYYRENEQSYRRVEDTGLGHIEWRGEQYFRLSSEVTAGLRGAVPPNLEEPLFFGLIDSVYQWGKASDDRTLVLYDPSLWCLTDPELVPQKVNGLEFYSNGLQSIIIEGVGHQLCFSGIGDRDGDTMTLTTGHDERYELSWDAIDIDWLRDASHTLLPRNPRLSLYNAEQERVNCNAFEYQLGNTWRPYNANTHLNWGWVKFRARVGDRYIVSRPAFFIGDLAFTTFEERATSVELAITGANRNRVCLLEERNPLLAITHIEGDACRYRLALRNEPGNGYPTSFNFVLSVDGGRDVRLSIAPRFTGVVLVKSTDAGNGLRLGAGCNVFLSGLHLYQVYWFGENEPTVRLSQMLQIPSESVRRANSLDCFRGEIDEFRTLYGIRPFEDIPVELSLGDRMQVNLVEYNLTIHQGDDDRRLRVYHNGEPIRFEGKLYAVPLDGDLYADELVPIELGSQDQGYSFGFAECPQCFRYVVFSSYCSQGKVKPQEFFWGCNGDEMETREELQREFVQALLQGSADESRENWAKVLRLLGIAYDRYLPLATFYQIEAVCSTESLYAMFLFQLVRNGSERLLPQLSKQFRDEFAIAPIFVRQDTIETIVEALPEQDLGYVQRWMNILRNREPRRNGGRISLEQMEACLVDVFPRGVSIAEGTLRLNADYYEGVLHNAPQMREVLKAPFVLYEHHVGVDGGDLWGVDSEPIRRIINYCREYYPNYFEAVYQLLFPTNHN